MRLQELAGPKPNVVGVEFGVPADAPELHRTNDLLTEQVRGPLDSAFAACHQLTPVGPANEAGVCAESDRGDAVAAAEKAAIDEDLRTMSRATLTRPRSGRSTSSART